MSRRARSRHGSTLGARSRHASSCSEGIARRPDWRAGRSEVPGSSQKRTLAVTAACVQQLLYYGLVSVGFRPTEEDLRVIEANRRADEKTSDVIRRALRLLDREAWEERARADMHRLRGEDLSAEPDAWEYAADGSIQITGSSLTVPARTADQG
jgi:Arc/MetJ-type ribon-helix-helix transcriptional regulator